MRTYLILFGIILLKNFRTSLSIPLVYTKITDCGDGKHGSFVASVTPNPFLWEDSSDSAFWLGARFSFTEEAKIIVSNLSIDDFIEGLQLSYIVEEPSLASLPSFVKERLNRSNNTRACGSILARNLCPTILQGLISKLTNITAFSSFKWGYNRHKFTLNLIDFLSKMAQVKLHSQLRIALYGQTLICMRVAIKVSHFDDINGTASDYRSKNILHAFDTPKIVNIFDQNKTLSCPENSKEINNSSCKCNPPFSGPLCAFQCQYDEIITSICPSGADEGTFACTFIDRDYIQYCIRGKNVQYLDGSVTVDIISLNHINIKWKLVHFQAIYQYEIILEDINGRLGSIIHEELNLNELETSYILNSLCFNVVVLGIACRNTIYNKQGCYNCPDLALKPFHDYAIVLKLGDGYKMVNYVNFTTPEVDIMAPKITSAALNNDQNFVTVDWMLTDQYCPGYIRRYQLIVSCKSDQAVLSGNLHFDCRNGFQGPKLNSTIPGKCKSEDIYIKLRIGTANSTSDESEQFLLKNEAWSTWVIIACVLGTVLVAAAIFSVVLFYLYKRHVKTFQNAHQAVRKLLHIQRKSGVGQSFRARSAPDLPIPDIPEGCNSPGETAYQTIAATSEVGTPHSLQAPEIPNETVPTTPRDSLGYTLTGVNHQTSSTTPRDSCDYSLMNTQHETDSSTPCDSLGYKIVEIL